LPVSVGRDERVAIVRRRDRQPAALRSAYLLGSRIAPFERRLAHEARWRYPATGHNDMTRLLAVAAILTTFASARARIPQGAAPAPEGTRHAYFAVVDRKGDPVTDLRSADVRIRADGEERQVLGVQRAPAPLEIALLVDDSGPGLRFIREGVGAFIQRLGGHAEMSLTSTGGKNTALVDFTTQVNDLYAGVRQLTTRNTANSVDGAYLLDAVHNAIDSLNTRTPERPVIVIVTLEAAEFSSRRADRLLAELQGSRAVLHVVSLGKTTLKTMSSWNEGPMQSLREGLDENMNRKKFLEDGAGSPAAGSSRYLWIRACRRR
jgi:hypothetical protein